jgi:hypothetical protein
MGKSDFIMSGEGTANANSVFGEDSWQRAVSRTRGRVGDRVRGSKTEGGWQRTAIAHR